MEYIFSLHNLLFMGFLQSSLVMLLQKNKTTSTISQRIWRSIPTKKLEQGNNILHNIILQYIPFSVQIRLVLRIVHAEHLELTYIQSTIIMKVEFWVDFDPIFCEI